MSHENTITIKVDGRWVNIPTVINGEQLSDSAARSHAVKNNKLGKRFDSVDSAVKAAKKRSESFPKEKTEMPKTAEQKRIEKRVEEARKRDPEGLAAKEAETKRKAEIPPERTQTASRSAKLVKGVEIGQDRAKNTIRLRNQYSKFVVEQQSEGKAVPTFQEWVAKKFPNTKILK